jgi:hypothetical protein
MKESNMESFQEHINEYRTQLEKGSIQKAYKGLMEYIMDLRTYFKNKYPGYFVSGSIYYGYMDMTYFSFFPESLHRTENRYLLNHAMFRFESAKVIMQVQSNTEIFKESDESIPIVPTTKGVDSSSSTPAGNWISVIWIVE